MYVYVCICMYICVIQSRCKLDSYFSIINVWMMRQLCLRQIRRRHVFVNQRRRGGCFEENEMDYRQAGREVTCGISIYCMSLPILFRLILFCCQRVRLIRINELHPDYLNARIESCEDEGVSRLSTKANTPSSISSLVGSTTTITVRLRRPCVLYLLICTYPCNPAMLY